MEQLENKTAWSFNKLSEEKEMTIVEKIRARKAFEKELHEGLDSLKHTKDQVQKVFDM